MKILLTGASGFLGGNFCRFYSSIHQIHAVYNSHYFSHKNVISHKVNLTVEGEVAEVINKVRPDVIIHFAALSDPNICQQNPQSSYLQNVEVTEFLAHIAASQKIPLVFASTDLVFDGENAPYAETEHPKPVNIYGRHKAEAEQVVQQTYPEALICRLPLMYGNSYSNGISFLQPVLHKLQNKLNINLFTDEFRTIASAHSVCEGILMLIEKKQSGIFHLGGDESLSRFEMGKIICRIYGHDEKLLVPGLQNDVKMPAPRPRNVSLDNTKVKKLGWQPGKFADELLKLKSGIS